MAPEITWVWLPTPPYFVPVPKEAIERIPEAYKEFEATIWEGWKGCWLDILLMVHSAATQHTDTVPDPKEALRWQREGKLAEYYRWTFDSVMRNAANYLALSSLLGMVSSLVSLGKLFAIFKTMIR